MNNMAVEKVRGCEYRKVGGLYLVSEGQTLHCDRLPVVLNPCNHCGFEVPFSRVFMWIRPQFFFEDAERHHTDKNCSCPTLCAFCYPNRVTWRGEYEAWRKERLKNLKKEGYTPDEHPELFDPRLFPNFPIGFGFMWVGQKRGKWGYTPESFIQEAQTLGVSKRIPEIPKGLVLGKTWVFLAHKKVPIRNEAFGLNGLRKQEPEEKPAVFYAFMPTKVEMLIWKSQATPEYIESLEKQGITPVVIPDGDKDHAPRKKPQQEL